MILWTGEFACLPRNREGGGERSKCGIWYRQVQAYRRNGLDGAGVRSCFSTVLLPKFGPASYI